MSVIATTCLVLIHVVYAIYNAAYALLARHVHYPRLLTETRRRIPNHLGLLLTSDAGANEEDVRYVYERAVRDAMRWCRIVGISRLSAYDPQGILEESSDVIASLLNATSRPRRDLFFKNANFPPTPPLSEAGDSRARSPDPTLCEIDLSVTTLCVPGRTTGPSFTVHLLSPESSVAAIAQVTRGLIEKENCTHSPTPSSFKLSVTELEEILEGDSGFPAPDLIIVHHCSPSKRSKMPLELHGFPPWQVRLSEIYHDQYAATYWRWLMPWRRSHIVPLSEVKFRKALDEYASAEMRLGK